MSWRDRIAKVLAGKPGGPHEGGIMAYHSSPHDFDKFDLSKLRTGEGANVYGAGTYLAENPAVSGQGGQYWSSFFDRFKGPENLAADFLHANEFDRKAAADALRRQLSDPGYVWTAKSGKASDAEARDALKLLKGGALVGPRTYEVNFKAKPEELLDWDKPLKQQPQVLERIRDKFEFYPFKPEETGSSVYTGFVGYPYAGGASRDEAKQIISGRMGEAGIPGIRYLDEGSRPKNVVDAKHLAALARHNGDWPSAVDEIMRGYHASPKDVDAYRQQLLAKPLPTNNYVAFDPNKLDIMAKYGLPFAAGATGLGAVADQSAYAATPDTFDQRWGQQ